MKQIAITGATGYVGKFVMAELQTHDVALRALARATSDRSGFADHVAWVMGDMNDEAALHTLVQDADAVVHLAYAHIPGRYRGGEGENLDEWLQTNLIGSLNLLMAARNAGVQQFIFLSSRAVFSQTEPGRVLDETHPPSPDTHYGAYKTAVEAMMHSFAAVEGMQVTAVRATGVYGVTWPVSCSKWWDIVSTVVSGGEVTGSRAGTEVHGADVARVIWALLSQPELGIDVIHLSDLVVSRRQIVALAQQFSGVSGPLPPPPPAPPANMLVCRRLAETGIQLGGQAALEACIRQLVGHAQRGG